MTPRDLATLPPALLREDLSSVNDLVLSSLPDRWAEKKRGFHNAPFHLEWYHLLRTCRRLALVAPREHAKTEIGTVNMTAWRSIYYPCTWTYLFAQTLDQAVKIKERIDMAVGETRPDLITGAVQLSAKASVYANGSAVTVAGAGKAVRGAHPDVIIGDDVLEEGMCLTAFQRQKTARWWSGTISNMAHAGTIRSWAGRKHIMQPTRIYLIGTPFHRQDLLLSMKENPLYVYRRYAAEFRPDELVPGTWAVDAS